MTAQKTSPHTDELQRLVDDYGFRYVLIKGGAKRPSNNAWQEGVTRAQAEKWLSQGNNIGLAVPDGVILLDIDPRNDGGDSWKQLVTDLGIRGSFNTPIAETGGGGRHILLSAPIGFKAYGKVPGYPGIDIKQEGGYIVAPPSKHPSGNFYAWRKAPSDVAILAAPKPLLDLIERQHVASSGDFNPIDCDDAGLVLFEEVLAALDPEQFKAYDDWIEISMALHALVDGDETAGDLWVEWCQRDPDYGDQGQFEHWKSFSSGGVTAATALKFINKADPELADRVSRAIDFASSMAAKEFNPITQEEIDAIPPAYKSAVPLRKAYWARRSGLSSALPHYDWLFKYLLPRGAYAVLTGPTGVGKSQVALDLALHLAGGHDWQGHKCKVEGAKVGYIDVEQGLEGHLLRAAAWDKLKGLTYNQDNLYLSGITPQMVKGEDSAAFTAMLEGIKVLALDLVIFDTLSATMSGNVSDGDDVMALLRSKQRILDETNATVLFVAHMGKDKTRGNKGYTEITDQADLVFEIHHVDRTKEDWLVPVKNRWGRADGDRGWKMESKIMVLGADEDGDDITSVAVSFGDFEDVDPDRLPPASEAQKMEVILAAVADKPGRTARELAALLEKGKEVTAQLLNQLVEDGMVVVRSGTHGRKEHFTSGTLDVEDLLS